MHKIHRKFKSRKQVNQKAPVHEATNNQISEKEKTDFAHFWSNQMKEHSLFIYLLLSGDETFILQELAHDLYIEWSNFIQRTFPYVEDDKVFLDDSDFANISTSFSSFKEELHSLINKLRLFKLQILDELKSRWIGCILPSFIEHLLFELNNMESFLYNNEKPDQDFWNKVYCDHAGYLSKLLDPSEIETNKILEDVFKKIGNNGTSDLMKKFYSFSTNLVKKIEKLEIKSCINKVVMNHILRETQRSMPQL